MKLKPISVRVGRRHIEKGQRGSMTYCPIALALKEALITNFVEVTPEELRLNGYVYSMTRSMRRFAERFDNGETVKPMTIELDRGE